jgi:hypothetical protein
MFCDQTWDNQRLINGLMKQGGGHRIEIPLFKFEEKIKVFCCKTKRFYNTGKTSRQKLLAIFSTK